MTYTVGVDYVNESGSVNTSGVAKYVTREVVLNAPASGINVNLTVNVSDVSNLQVLYKVKPEASQQKFDDLNWEYFNNNGASDDDVIATAENSISGQFESQAAYQELKFSKEDLPDFSSFAIKIVMKSDNPAYVPKIQDMRAVASF